MFALVGGVGSREGDMTSALSGQLAGDHRVGSSLASTSRATLPALSELGCGHQLGEIRLRAFQHGSVSRDADRRHPREGIPN